MDQGSKPGGGGLEAAAFPRPEGAEVWAACFQPMRWVLPRLDAGVSERPEGQVHSSRQEGEIPAGLLLKPVLWWVDPAELSLLLPEPRLQSQLPLPPTPRKGDNM